MNDLVTNLRAVAWRLHGGEEVPPLERALIKLCGEAADEIERLSAPTLLRLVDAPEADDD